MLLALSLSLFVLADAATAQTTPRKTTTKKSVRKSRSGTKARRGKAYGSPGAYKPGKADPNRDTDYLAPGLPMRKQLGYKNMGTYSNRPPRPSYKKKTTTSTSNTLNTDTKK
jgi:hypothetical protein